MINDPIKEAHRAMWAAGDYAGIAADLVAPLGETLVAACDVTARERVLDVAAGTGNAAAAAARRGAHVVAADLTPELLNAGRAQYASDSDGTGRIQWVRADAEDLPFLDADFDVIVSCIGVMFAPYHERSAAELARVARPGGRIGLLAWTPEGFIGEMFTVMRPYAAPPPAGASAPVMWGSPDHVMALLGGSLRDVSMTKGTLRVDAFASAGPDTFRTYFKSRYGPTIATYRRHADDPAAQAALDRDLDALAARHAESDGCLEWEYLLLTGVRDE